jgi:hypothetical protein
LHEAAQNFELLSNIQDQKLKNQKPIAVDVLFKAYPLVPFSGRSNLAGRSLSNTLPVLSSSTVSVLVLMCTTFSRLFTTMS